MIDAMDEADDDASSDDDEGLLRRLKAWVRADREHASDWRREAKEDFEFRDGHQWSEEDKAILKEGMRPIITFNRTLPVIKSVVGLEIGNRREVRFLPRTAGDVQVNEMYTAAAEWARDECDAEDEETDAFMDAVTCGMGWIETRIDTDMDPQGIIIQERLDPLEMGWDKSARRRNLADARRLHRIRVMARSEARAMFPDAADGELDAKWLLDERDEPHDADPEAAYRQDEGEKSDDDDLVTIVHVQWWEREAYYRIVDPFTGDVAEFSAAEHEALQGRLRKLGMPLRSVRMMRRVYRQAFIGSVLLEAGPAPCDRHFSWECITGERDQVNGTWYGLVRTMKDPQRWANKWLAQSLHILNSQAKGGYFAERGVFDNDAEAEETIARQDKITWLKPNKIAEGKLLPKTTAQLPSGFSDLLQFAVSSIRDVSGVNLELLGLKDAQQAGVVEESRKQAGMTILATMFDSLRRYRKRQGRVLLYYIMHYISDGRLIRVVGEGSEKYIPLLKQPGTIEYDVIADDSPSSPNQKERVWGILMALLPVFGGMLTPQTVVTLLKYSPLPESVVQELEQQAQKAAEAARPQQEEQRQMLLQHHQAQIGKIASETAENQSQALLNRVKAETEVAAPMMEQHAAVAEMERGGQQETLPGVVQPQADHGAAIAEALTRLAQTQAQMATAMMAFAQNQAHVASALAAPQQIVRDETGRVVGSQRVI